MCILDERVEGFLSVSRKPSTLIVLGLATLTFSACGGSMSDSPGTTPGDAATDPSGDVTSPTVDAFQGDDDAAFEPDVSSSSDAADGRSEVDASEGGTPLS